MNTKYVICCVILFLVILSTCAVLAEDTIVVNVNYDTSMVEINGKIDEVNGDNVNLRVIGPDCTLEDIRALEPNAQNVFFKHVEQKTLENKQYDFKFVMDGDNGEYTAYINYGSKPLVKAFVFYKPETMKSDLTLINDKIRKKNLSPDDITVHLKDYFSNAIYYEGNNISSDGKIAVVEGIIKHGEFPSMEQLKIAVINYSSMQKIYETNDNSKVISILKENAQFFGIKDLSEYKNFITKDNKFQENLAERLRKTRMNDTETFLLKFKQDFVLTSVNMARNHDEIYDILKKGYESVKIKIDNYFTLASTRKVDEGIVGKSFDTIKKLEERIDELCKVNTDVGNGSGGSNKGGGRVKFETTGTVIAQPETPIPDVFSDVSSDHWGYESIMIMKEKGYISGDGTGNFRPNDSITRDEFLKIVLEALNLVDATAISTFSDIHHDDWSYKYIATAQKYGIISGKGNNTFDGRAKITREEAVHILYKTATFKNYILKSVREESDFTDQNEISEYAVPGLTVLYKAGIINGMGDGSFSPKSNTTRAEAVKMIFSLIQKTS